MPSQPDIQQELRDALDRVASHHTVSAGTILFVRGQTADGIRVLRRGRVELYMPSPDVRHHLPLRTVEPGYVLGLPALFTGKPFDFTARAIEECEFSLVERSAALKLMRERLDLCLEAAVQMAGELGFLREWFADFGRPPC